MLFAFINVVMLIRLFTKDAFDPNSLVFVICSPLLNYIILLLVNIVALMLNKVCDFISNIKYSARFDI